MSIGKEKRTTTTTTTTEVLVTKGVVLQPSGVFPGKSSGFSGLFPLPGSKPGEFIEELRNHGEGKSLGIHVGDVVVGQVGGGEAGNHEWPLLPGSSPEFKPEVRAEACWTRRAAKPRSFNLGNLGEWPCLEQGKGGRIKSQEFGGLLDGNGDLFASTSCPDERADILTSTGPTGENQLKSFHLGGFTTAKRAAQSIQGGGVGVGGGGGGGERCRGWIRLPPIPKRWRVESSSAQDSNSNSNSNSLGPVGGNIFKGRNGGRDGVGGGSGRGDGLPPVYLMLNRDFIVISPLKENLLLTLALTRRNPSCEAEMDAEVVAESVVCGNKRPRRHVFVGRFEAFSSFVRFGLGRDARRVVTEANAGGTSTISESLSVEYFVRKFQAKDVVTEMEVEYCAMNWKKVDYICSLYDQRVGVSVTRAMSYPNPVDFSPQMAYRLLYKKLFGLVVARHGVTERHSFSQCILHVWCETTTTAKLLEAQYKQVSEELDITDDVIMVLTVAEGWHARPIFYEHCLERS